MSDTPTPSRKTNPHPAVDRSAPHSVVIGMGIVRKPLFRAPISQDGWQKVMLTHIAAAKSLGFTMFEIDTAEGEITRRKQKKQAEATGYTLGWSVFRVEGDEWKEPVVEVESDGPTETIRTTIVSVYALAIE